MNDESDLVGDEVTKTERLLKHRKNNSEFYEIVYALSATPFRPYKPLAALAL